MKPLPFLISLNLLIASPAILLSQINETNSNFTAGPETGTLLIAGCAATVPIFERFIELAGGNAQPSLELEF